MGLQGKFGAHVDPGWLPSFNVDILTLSAAALLQVETPNPTYFDGTVAVDLSVLDIFSIKYDVSFSYGTTCGSVIN